MSSSSTIGSEITEASDMATAWVLNVPPLILAGVGIAVVSDSWRALARSAGAAVRALDCPDVLQVSLVYRPGRLSPAAAAFLDLADARVGSLGR